MVDQSDNAVQGPAASCPLGVAINLIGGRWKMHVLRALFLSGPQRYNALLIGIDGISAKELTRNLRELESAHLIACPPPTDLDRCYRLTDLGTDLLPTFQNLGRFGQKVVDERRARPDHATASVSRSAPSGSTARRRGAAPADHKRRPGDVGRQGGHSADY